MSTSFLYYFLMLLTLSSGDMSGMSHHPITHVNDVQIYYFYDSRMPSDFATHTMYLTENLLSKQYADLIESGDIIFYKIDLATPKGQKVARKCNIVLSGLVVARNNKVVDLTQSAYQMVRNQPIEFQQNLAFTINRLLPKSKRR